MTTPLPTALDYAARGWRIVPIRPGEKRPALTNWQNIASNDRDLITEWFTGPYSDHGIGIATGPDTGIFVLDVDITDTKAGDETLADLEQLASPWRSQRLPVSEASLVDATIDAFTGLLLGSSA